MGINVELVRGIMKEKGITVRELARKAGIDKSTVIRTLQNPTSARLDTVHAIAGGLEVPTSSLIDDSGGQVNEDKLKLLQLWDSADDATKAAILVLLEQRTH